MSDPLVTIDDVRAAAAVLDGVANRTPVVTSRTLRDRLGVASAALKCESFQRSGSFKFRGAYNLLSGLGDDERAAGVCAVSSGNHAQALSLAASLLGIRAAILMPEDAPAAKMAATRGYGAEVVTYDRYSMPQVEAGRRFQQERGMTFAPAYDHPRTMAGAGTAALELWEDAGPFDVVVAPVGGGGGLAGYATVAKALGPDTRVVGVESAASGVNKQSLEAGARVQVPVPRTIADGQALTTPGELTFEVIRRTVDDVVLVEDDDILEAMAFLFDRMKLVTEPSGAISVAALLAGRVPDIEGKRVGVIVSGGNVGLARFLDLMGERAARVAAAAGG